MKKLAFWQGKLYHLLHDPLHKPLLQKTGVKHASMARDIAAALSISVPTSKVHAAPDRLATGADRPNVGNAKICQVNWRAKPVIVHPLQPGACLQSEALRVPPGSGSRRAAEELTSELLGYYESLQRSEDDPSEGEGDGAPEASADLARDADSIRRAHLEAWRTAPEALRELELAEAWLPADSRSPDHSVHAHTKVASAAAFIYPMSHEGDEGARTPYLLGVKLGGVQRFIEQTRTTRDLWTASMIYAELAWAALLPIVEQYGPDAIVYPDLLENPIVDQWLLDHAPGAVPDEVRSAGAVTHAAMLPNVFVALVPKGGEGELESIHSLMRRVEESTWRRWSELAQAVRTRLREKVGEGKWTAVWDRQLAPDRMPPLSWAAVPWLRRMIADKESPKTGLGPFAENLPAVPGRPEGAPRGSLPAVLLQREKVLAPWVGEQVWQHYEHVHRVFWQTDDVVARNGRSFWPYLSSERGFDYPIVHHQLRAALAAAHSQMPAADFREGGERCMLTAREEALSNAPAGDGPGLMEQRHAARKFWSHSRLDPDGTGDERLGGIAALKRYLSESNDEQFIRRWSGKKSLDERPPFPSTATLASQRFLLTVGLLWTRRPEVRAAGQAMLKALKATRLERDTSRVDALPRLWRVAQEGTADLREFLGIETEYFFTETHTTLRRRHADQQREIQALTARTRGFLEVLAAALKDEQGGDSTRPLGDLESPTADPGRFFAVLKMDGDSLGRLILGDPEVIAARWRDVLHPDAVRQIEKSDALAATGWRGLLDRPRVTGPSLHAAISRALGEFSHRIVGWVVEREFGGRLIYTGGDDLLALLPAEDGLAAAARLQQLFSAPFVLDTRPDQRWQWRTGPVDTVVDDAGQPFTVDLNGRHERERFQIPSLKYDGGDVPTLSTVRWESHAASADSSSAFVPSEHDRALFMQLGRGHSLSGALVIAHYRTPLRNLLRRAKSLLERAKERPNKGAIAMARHTRGGPKEVFIAPWRLPSPAPRDSRRVDSDPPNTHTAISCVQRMFETGSLSSRVPYKLREALARASVAALPDGTSGRPDESAQGDAGAKKVRDGIVRSVLGGTQPPYDEICHLVDIGLQTDSRSKRSRNELWSEQRAHEAVAGVLLARRLAGGGEEED